MRHYEALKPKSQIPPINTAKTPSPIPNDYLISMQETSANTLALIVHSNISSKLPIKELENPKILSPSTISTLQSPENTNTNTTHDHT